MDSYPPKNYVLEDAITHAAWAAKKVRREKSQFWTYNYTSQFAFEKGELFLEQEPGKSTTLFDPVGKCWIVDSMHQVNRDLESPFGRTLQSDSALVLYEDGSLAFVSYSEYRAGGEDGKSHSARFRLRHVEALDLLALDFAKDRMDVDDQWESWYWPESLYRNVPWGQTYSGDHKVKYEIGVKKPGDGFLGAIRKVAMTADLGSAPLPASPSIADRRIAAFDSIVAKLVKDREERRRENEVAEERERAQRALEWERNRPSREKLARQKAEEKSGKAKRLAARKNSKSWWWARRRGVLSFLFVSMWTTVLYDAEFPATGRPLQEGELYANALLHLVLLAAIFGLVTASVSLFLGMGSIVVPFAASLYIIYETLWNRYPIRDLTWVAIDSEPTADLFVGKLWEGLTQPLILIFLSLIASRFLVIWMAETNDSRVR